MMNMHKLNAFPFTSKLSYDEHGWPQLDRAVTSEVLRQIYKRYFTNGVFGISDSTCFQVSVATGGAGVSIAPGACQIQGATGYEENAVTLEITPNSANLPRIDTVVARLNDNSDYRSIYFDILEGTPAATPAAPALTQSDSVCELGLCNIARAANSSVITNSNITDTRADSARCGYVTAIQQLDTASLYQQFRAYIQEVQDALDAADATYNETAQNYLTTLETTGDAQLADITQAFNAYAAVTEEEFNNWFASIRDILDEDVAGHLQNEIDEHEDRLALLEQMVIQNQISAPIDLNEVEGGTPILLTDDLGVALLADWKYKYA
jgi:hypothetical protein